MHLIQRRMQDTDLLSVINQDAPLPGSNQKMPGRNWQNGIDGMSLGVRG
jgi:hypothetical protein